MPRISDQLKRHSVALISLFIAISSLAYNSWRNEQSEANRNIRTAGIELLIKLGELDRIVLHAQYPIDVERRDDEDTFMYIRSGWAYVLTVRDLGSLMPEPAASASTNLFEIWSAHSAGLGGESETAFDAISPGIDRLRSDVLTVLAMLD